MMNEFPEGFLWGAATAAHQVEGNNINSDFWVFEHTPGTIFAEPSGDACDHYRLFRKDIQMLHELGLNAYRFSIEWARVEPEPGFISRASLYHYREVLETERARLDKILSNNEVKALISALGTGIGDSFDLSGLRYGRVVIMTDADVDGSHIRTLLLTFFFRYMQPLIEEGHLYIAQPPLYRVAYRNQVRYAYTEADLSRVLKELGVSADKVSLQRYKGLGEMNPTQLWETTMNPENRTLLSVSIEDAAAADRTFDMLMGAAVPPRTKFITTHARDVRNLDI
ncbi:type IIA topoisomerase [Anaerolinea thermolimosa]|nr:family 1 glycosylhydrolase [Anaerolinea thermolimosa]GAP07355.1 type IIA topoisomerase [Anaerolinea thermolimosa]